MSAVDRAQVLAYRYTAHDLAPGGGRGDTVLATGLQDYPPGRTAVPALRLRTGTADPSGPSTVLVHSIRGAMHLHRAADLARLAAALRVEDGRDLPPQAIGPFGAELAGAGIAFGAALDEVAAAMREAVAGGGSPTKGELSGTVSPRVAAPLAPWCEGCGVHHVQDKLFRMATLQAGLVIEVDHDLPSRFRFRAAEPFEPADPADARAALVRAFLATSGPSRPAQLASWLAFTPAAARRWWEPVAAELTPVTVDGAKYWTHADHQEALKSAPAPDGVRLLPPYDPVTEPADRELLVPDPAQRKQVWRTAANPGVLLVDGEISGVWRQRRSRGRLSLRVEPFTRLSARRRRAAEPDAAAIADPTGTAGADLAWA
ncbi:DNA glycosylase AlkZ-like family protein [Actinomadura rugatobispora]|uniref:DNA glycosylase AlkZ-like family protein n=1 Tax=Actinomadura rugatobispora TaxID=1994 RepID=A0ABW1AB54_9ACTN|nr:crosslink repair DNA glycosylase YcaQ family protein [Actinomadura rugatobispora]